MLLSAITDIPKSAVDALAGLAIYDASQLGGQPASALPHLARHLGVSVDEVRAYVETARATLSLERQRTLSAPTDLGQWPLGGALPPATTDEPDHTS